MPVPATGRPTRPERMDAADVDPAEIAAAFRFIRWVNRALGGTGSLLDAIDEALPGVRTLRLLDCGTGAADIPLAVARWADARGIQFSCTAIDSHPACLAVARAAAGSDERIRIESRDARSVDRAFAPGSFDVAHAGMFLHHLDDADVVGTLAAMGQVARVVVWNDLLRSAFSRTGIRLLTLGQPAIVRDDALLSVEKGFTVDEAIALTEAAGLTVRRCRRRAVVGRFVLVATAADQGLAAG